MRHSTADATEFGLVYFQKARRTEDRQPELTETYPLLSRAAILPDGNILYLNYVAEIAEATPAFLRTNAYYIVRSNTMEPNQTMNESGIRIDLTKQNSVIYQQESLFQKALYDKLNVLLDAQWDYLQSIQEDQKRKISLCRIHNAILVYGERGSGKTVFLSNIEKNVKENHYVFFDIVDPTLLSNSKVVDCCEAFCSILVGIVHDYLDKNVFRKNLAKEEDKETYKNKFREVAECLSALKNAKNESGLDSIFFHGNAIALEQKLHEFFEVITQRLLHRKLLCFRLDDIDMSFESGYLCLETMRKYFSSPWVIPIVCGDISLYQTLIEKEYLKSFSPNDIKWMEAIARKREDFSSKYLTKIFPNNLRLEIVSCADLVSQNYNQIFFAFGHEEKSINVELKDIDNYIDMYFNHGVGQDQYKNNVLSSYNDKDSRSIVQDSLRVWIQFHEKMFPFYNKIAEMKTTGQDAGFDGNLYIQFQESLVDFFDSQKKYQIIADLARINVNSTSTTPNLTYNYKDALIALSKEKDSLTCFEGQYSFDRELRVSHPSSKDVFFDNDTERNQFLFLVQLFSFDNSKEETSKYLEVFSGRFVHLVFSTLFNKDCNIGEIMSEIPPFCSFGANADVMGNDDDGKDDARDKLPLWQSLAGKTVDDLWKEIMKEKSHTKSNTGTRPFFDVNFLQKALSLYYDNLNAYRKQKYDNESILDYMLRCVVMLLHSVYSCERKDLIPYKMIGLTKKYDNFWDKKHEKINSVFFPEISLLTEKRLENSILYYLYHHPLVQFIQDMALKYFRKRIERSELKPYLPIDYLKKGISDSVIRQRIEIASSLDEINDILQSVDKQTMVVISKFTPRSNAFKRIKKMYNDTTNERSKSLYNQLCRTNNLSNLVTSSPAWERCDTNV